MAKTRTPKRAGSEKEFDPSRWAHASFVLGGFMAAWVLSNFVETVWSLSWSAWPQSFSRPSANLSKVSGSVMAMVLTLWAWRKEEYFRFMSEVATEVSQIVWPTKAETRAATIVVCVLTLICAFLLFGMDQTWRAFTNFLYSI